MSVGERSEVSLVSENSKSDWPRTRRFLSLQAKASLLVFGVSAFVAVSLLSYFLWHAVVVDMHAGVSQKAQLLAMNLAVNCEYDLLIEKRPALEHLATGVARSPDVVYVIIQDSRGRVLARTGRMAEESLVVLRGELNRDAFATEEPTCRFLEPHGMGRLYEAVVPVILGDGVVAGDIGGRHTGQAPGAPRRIGVVRVGMTLANALAEVVRKGSLATAAALVVLLIATTATTLLVRGIVSPIIELRDMTVAVADGDFSQMANAAPRNEVGDLAAAFNEMTRKLRDTTVSLDELTALIAGKEQAERLLRESETRFRQITDNAGEWIWEVDDDGLYTYSSNTVKEMLGYQPDEIVGKKRYYDLFHPRDRESLKKTAVEVFASKSPFRELRNRNVHKDGREVWLSTSAVPMLGADGSLLGYRGADTDITDRIAFEQEIQSARDKLERRVEERTSELNRRMEEAETLNSAMINLMEDARRANAELRDASAELRVVNQQLGAFSRSVSHDLRAPLRHMRGFVELLRKQTGGALDRKGERYLDLISDATDRMGKLIDDLLAFSRAGRMQMRNDPVSLSQIMTEAKREALEGATARDIAWNIPALPSVMGDRAMLKLAFVNLLSNAVKYTGGELHATIDVELASASDEEIVVAVRDNGVGFDAKYADRIFDVFQRLHAKSEFEGTGIGLANVRQVVVRHGGRVWAEGKVGEGAGFFVALPRGQQLKNRNAAL